MPSLLQNTFLSSSKKLTFDVTDAGWYIVKVSARVKSKKQRGNNQTDDEELIVKIDNKTFPKIGTKQALFNSPASFNGGEQHNTDKTIYFLIQLEEGEHIIIFEPQHGAEVIEVSYEPVHVSDNQIELTLNKQAEDRDRTTWITFVLVGNEIKNITTTIDLWWRWFDGDDVQVVVDSEIKKNPTSLFHNNWMYSARPIIDLGGRTQTETFSIPSDSSKLHYVEFLADRMPKINSVSFSFKDATYDGETPQQYQQGHLGEDYNKYDSAITDGVSYWNDIFLDQKYPPPQALDHNLIKAVIYIESAMGYYQSPEGYYPAHPDIMQIADPRNPAIHALRNDGWVDPSTNSPSEEYEWTEDGIKILDYESKPNGNTPEESIKWGVRWLYHKAQVITKDEKRSWKDWSQAIRDYNGLGNTRYVEEIYNVYQKGTVRRDSQQPIKLWSVILVFITSTLLIGGFLQRGLTESGSHKKQSEIIAEVRELMEEKMVIYQAGNLDYYGDHFKEPVFLCNNHEICYPELIFPAYIPKLVAGAKSIEQFIQAAGSMDLLDSTNSATGDFDNDGQNEIAFVVPDYLNREYTMLMVIDKVEGGFKLDQRKIPLGYLSSAISSTKHEGAIETRDLTGDAIPELLVFASNWRWGARLYTFAYSQGKINQLFALDGAYNHPTFTFSDQNNNRITEIHATGEKLGLMAYDFECNACLHVRVKDVYEYQPETQSFLQTEKKYYGHAGALTTFLEEVGEFRYDHPLLQYWSVDKKKRFSYTLDQLEESGVSSLFESTDPQQYFSKEERDIVTVQLKRPMKLSDLAVREEESSNEKERRLSYYISSPAYEAVIKKSGGEWKVTAFDEIN